MSVPGIPRPGAASLLPNRYGKHQRGSLVTDQVSRLGLPPVR
jgi:hypothetical protein